LEPFSRTYITIVAPGADRRWIADGHVPVLDALRRRDADLIVEILHQHFANAAAMLGSHWEKAAQPAGAAEGGATPAGDAPLRVRRPRSKPTPPLAERTA
jgi:hypothetical protein